MVFRIIFLLYFLSTSLTSQVDRSNALINFNDMAFWVSNDGRIANMPNGDQGGFYTENRYPVIFTDGIIWGGYVAEGDIRVGGQTYLSGTQPGWIENGIASNPENSRIYKIRKDWATLSHNQVKREAADYYDVNILNVTEDMTKSIITQYRTDWYEWPAERGAPFYDLDNNGYYDPQTDIPGLLDADQVLWFVVNDLDSSKTKALYGSEPIGIEAQYTLWAYENNGSLGQFFYKRIKLINKSAYELEDFYIAQWSDVDVGSFANDLTGCDSTTYLMFAYSESQFHNFDPPVAVGYKLLQGPKIPAAGDSALQDLKWIAGFKNLLATSFAYFSPGNASYSDPSLGDYDGTLQWYNMLRGFYPNTDIENPTPFTHRRDFSGNGPETKWPLNGDPLLPWAFDNDIDGHGFNRAAGDHRMALSSGPFNMAAGDTQEVVYAVIGGLGDNNLDAVTEVKYNAETAKLYYFGQLAEFEPSSPNPPYAPPYQFIFKRPYPNPFNPTVNFKYEIVEEGMVNINVYNILGQRATVLFNDLADAGENIFSWEASSFATGVYIIQINYKSYSLSHKVLLLK